jgi:hypothetical protein
VSRKGDGTVHLAFRRFVYSLGLALALVSLLAACGAPTAGTQTAVAGGTGGTGNTGGITVGTAEVAPLATTPGAGAGNAGPESTSEVGAVGQSTEAAGGTTGTGGNATQAAGLGGNATEAAGGTTGTGNMVPVPPGELDPCTLLTKSDVESAVSTTMNEPTRSADQYNVLSCNYTSTSTPATTVNFSLFQGPDQMQIAQQNMSQATNQAVTGVGDQAVQTANGLLVKSGDLFFSMQVVLANQPDKSNDTAKQLATLVLQHLASATAVPTAVPTEAATP